MSQSVAMSTAQAPSATLVSASPESASFQENPLPLNAIIILMGHPLTCEIGKCTQKWILYQGILDYTDLVITWDPKQSGNNIPLSKE